MSLSRKHYIELANIFKEYDEKTKIIDNLCKYLKKDNQRFNETKFRQHIKTGVTNWHNSQK